jgi:FixJ family two-component response regulator/signal transduction histidine kinase
VNGRPANLDRRGATAARADFNAALVERLAFERLLADLSVRFANIAPDDAVAAIERALVELVDFFDYDRCTYSEFGADGSLNVLCSAAVRGIEPLPRGPFGTALMWFLGELRAGRTVALVNLPEGLPPQAATEAAHCRRLELRAHLSIPLRVRGRVSGVLSFAAFRAARSWSAELITRLTIIGEVFAGAMARARSEEESQQLRRRLWHADRMARIGALTAAIAHEINQPLAAILGNAQAGLRYLERGAEGLPEIRAILEAVVRDDKRAAETIRTMRNLLRRDDTDRARIDLAAALREVLQLLAADLSRQEIRVEAALDTPCWVMADRAQIEHLALNLMLNAAAAMASRPRDERVLRVSAARTGDAHVVAAVCDSGTGIAPEHLDSVFEPFWTTRKEGLGLGLAICRSIAQAHGGTISVEPNRDRGVTFRFAVPAHASDGDGHVASVAAGQVRRELAARGPAVPMVCVIDDDPAVRESLARVLKGAGWAADCFASAEAFFARAGRADAACVLLDVRMPGMSGLELQERLSNGKAAPPIVFLTGEADVATGVAAMKRGAVDYLVKPVDADALVAAVGKALARHDGERKRALERDAYLARLGRLSAREREVLAQVVRGRLNKQIAADLDIAEQTVKQHRARVMEKMEVRSVAELVRICDAAGLAPGKGA